MRVSKLKCQYLTGLEHAGIERAESLCEIELVIRKICDCTSKEICLDFEPTKHQEEKIKSILQQRIQTKRPIQQLLGSADFCGEEFFVNEYTLIPRPETEILVSEAVELLRKKHNPKILDIGTGSGNIACCIAKQIETAEVIGIDISTNALQVAIRNADKLSVTKKAMFRKSNIFSNVSETFDMIVSNPPYIPRKDKVLLQPEVKNFEPDLALFSDDNDGIDFYISIISEASQYLNLEGYLIFEVGINQSEKVQDILTENYFRVVKVIKDFNNIERVIVAQID